MFVKLVLLITLFGAFLYNFFNGFRISVKFCIFLISFFIFLPKNFFGVILPLFQNFEAKCAKNGSKNQKTYLVNVSSISILYPSKGLYSSFSKKKSNSLYPTIHRLTGSISWNRFLGSLKVYKFGLGLVLVNLTRDVLNSSL
jgi:hypothetical protein